jgi:hypothetical protein
VLFENHHSDTLTSTVESFSIGEYTTTIINNSFTISHIFLSGFDGAWYWFTNGTVIQVFPVDVKTVGGAGIGMGDGRFLRSGFQYG